MPKKKAKPEPPAEEAHPRVKEDPKVVFEQWFKACSESQKKTIFEVDARLTEIQKDKNNLKRELQPLRVGMELSRVKEIIVGRSGKANPQQETGRIWGAYRDSHLKSAGYSKSSCDTYVGMIDEARKILPDDKLITALLDHTNDQGAVVMSGGNKEKPFGKFTAYLRSEDVQEHIKDGKVNLDDLSADDLVANVFDPKNAETPDPLANMTLAVNTAVKRIFAEVKAKDLAAGKPLETAQVTKNSSKYVRYVVECLLTACNCPNMAFDLMLEEHLKSDDIITLDSLVKEANEKKQKAAAAKPTKKKKVAKTVHVRQEPEKVADTRMGKYSIRKNPKPQFPKTPWEVFRDGNDKPVVRLQDRLQAQQYVEEHLLPKDAHSDRPPSPAAAQQQNEEIRKQREPARGGKEYDAG